LFSDDEDLLARPSYLSSFAPPSGNTTAVSSPKKKRFKKGTGSKADKEAERATKALARQEKKDRVEKEKRDKARIKLLLLEAKGKYAVEETCVMMENVRPSDDWVEGYPVQ